MNATTATHKDVEISDPPTDSISSIAFNKQHDYLAVASWDNNVRVYEINDGGSVGRAIYTHTAPVLSVTWSTDHTKVISGGADNKGHMLDISTDWSVPGSQTSVLATGSWDKTLRYWDFRAPRPVAAATLAERCFAMDSQADILAVGTADRQVQIFNMKNPTNPYKTFASPLKMQTRAITCFTSGSSSGLAIGSVEGRVAIHYIDDKDREKGYSFRCHRADTVPGKKDQAKVYAVNDIQFHPVHTTTFSTCGSDGIANYWDRDRRMRLKTFEAAPGSITTSAFNRNGDLFAYAISYDWSKGHAGMTPGYPNKLMLHKVEAAEAKPRASLR